MTKVTGGTVLPQDNNPKTVFIPIFGEISKDQLKKSLNAYEVNGTEQIFQMEPVKSGFSMQLFSPNPEIDSIILIGMGKDDCGSIKGLTIKAGAQFKKSITPEIIVDPSLIDGDIETCLEQMMCGLYLGIQEVGYYKSGESESRSISGCQILNDDTSLIKAARQGFIKGETIASIIKLVNAPSNFKSTDDMAGWLSESSSTYGYDLTILEKPQLEKEGFHALLAVNRGSEYPAKCLIARYRPKNKKKLKKVTLVGKGVTFDTGGLSIKGSANMHYMKSDMGGAAAVMGTIELAARLKLQVDLRVIVPTTDNSVDARAIKPGDVISSYSGKTIEVIDTDAEGRLILADALSYAVKNDTPDIIIDLATLTGSVVRALGTEAAGVMSHNDELVAQLTEAGDQVGERIWRLPLWKAYAAYMDSDIADIKNLSSKPMAGSITAGKFLEAFVEEHPMWAHMDIAGTAFGTYPTTKAYSGTGYGIDLLIKWLSSINN
jgi:leucyl aminopeptidase